MSKQRNNKDDHDEELNFWQPTSDMLTALLLIFLLFIIFFGLQHLLINENTDKDYGNEVADNLQGIDAEGYGEDEYEGNEWEKSEDTAPTIANSSGGGGGGGEGESEEEGEEESGGGEGEEEHLYDDPPSAGSGVGPGIYPDEGVKSAVYVVMVDAETDRTIKEKGILFELYGADNSLQILNTYYPEKITYRQYETTEAGVFYLPEKIWHGDYYMHELTEPKGYDAAENQPFTIDQLYDWPEPYVVKMPLYPSRNIVRVQMNDTETGQAISGGTFNVIARTDIITQDGTLRYKEGEIVDTITCDEEGYGESEPLYLGEYTIRQAGIPKYYASVQEDVDTEVKKKTDVLPEVNTIESEKTRVTVRLVDELYEERAIAGAEFTVSDGRNSQTYTTDSTGSFVIEDLDKNRSYTITQDSTTGTYRINKDNNGFNVSTSGRFGTDAEKEVVLTNRMLRASVSLEESFLKTPVENVSMTLYNEADEPVNTWTTTAAPCVMTNLDEGNYYVIADGDEENRYPLTITDTKDVQELVISKLTVKSIAAMVGAAGAAIGLLAGGIVLLRNLLSKKRKKKR